MQNVLFSPRSLRVGSHTHTQLNQAPNLSPQRPVRGQRLQRVRGEGTARRVQATAIARPHIDGLGLHLGLCQLAWLGSGLGLGLGLGC